MKVPDPANFARVLAGHYGPDSLPGRGTETRVPDGVVAATERHQVTIYLAAIAAGGILGWVAPGAGPGLEHALNPFLKAFAFLLAVPLELAWTVQAWAARRPAGRSVAAAAGTAMVPLMAATLLTVVASQVPKLDDNLADIGRVAPFYVLFLLVMAFAGLAVARLFHLDVPAGRAVVFTGATRNSLVVLPLALALPDQLATLQPGRHTPLPRSKPRRQRSSTTPADRPQPRTSPISPRRPTPHLPTKPLIMRTHTTAITRPTAGPPLNCT